MVVLTVVGVDGSSGLPLEFIRVNGDLMDVGTRSNMRGNRAELLIPDNSKQVWVGSPGYMGQFYPIPRQAHVNIFAKLWPAKPRLLEIEAVPDGLKGERLEIHVRNHNPMHRPANTRPKWVRLDQLGRGKLVLSEGARIKIEIWNQKINGQYWKFKPIQDILDSQGSVIFRAEPYKK